MYDVILVDDETLIRATLRNIIDWEAENFRIVLDASNGKQAFDFIRGGVHFDLLITDMKMPVMDGIDLLRNIQPYKKSGCILALSSYNDFYLVREAFRLGATDYILKTDIGQQNFLRKIQQTKELLDKLKSGGMDNGQSVQTDFSQVHYTKNLQTLLEETLCGKNNNPEDFLSGAEEKGIPCGNYSIAGLYCGIRDMNGVKIEQMREKIVTGLYMRDLKEAQKECLLRVLLEYMEKQYSRKQDDIMLRARKFIVDNYANPELSASSVATYTGLSEKYFSTRFTKETGSTFIAYLTDLRMMKAKELLLKTDFKTYEIAALAGYNSAEHFIRVFKKNTGITPSEFRSTR